MAQFSVNPSRFDPYKNFKFRVKWDGRYVAGISKVSALKRTTEVVKHREGGDPSSTRKSPGRTEYEAITLERGVTHDTEFEKWANKVWNFGSGLGLETSLSDFRKDITIDVYNEAGHVLVVPLHAELEVLVRVEPVRVHRELGHVDLLRRRSGSSGSASRRRTPPGGAARSRRGC